MKSTQLAIIVAALLAMSVQAADTNPAPDSVPTGLAAPMLDIPAAAEAAVETVDRFSRTLASGQLEAAARELDAKAVIFESGATAKSWAGFRLDAGANRTISPAPWSSWRPPRRTTSTARSCRLTGVG